MIIKNLKIILVVSMIVCIFIASSVMAQEETLDPKIPESWFEAPKLASEIGIEEFSQSPILDEKLEKGEIEPVRDRLPDDPPVVETYEKIGQYGGTANLWGTSIGLGENNRYFLYNTAGQATPDGNEILPILIKDWEYSNNYKNITLKLRKGMKWSDGHPFTSEDFMFWWEHIAKNETLTPIPPEEWTPAPLLDVTSQDKYTVTFKYGKSYPRAHDFNFTYNFIADPRPAHFMKQFHPDFEDEEQLTEKAKELNLDSWDEYFNRISDDSPEHPEYENVRPVLRPYIATERTETSLVMERNPYYPFVDTEGNQLPYIDRLRLNLANSDEMASMKAATGEATLAARYLVPSDIPLFKKNEDKEDYKTYLYSRVRGANPTIHVNLTHDNSKLESIFQDVRFRKALSLSINRERINEKVYFGHAIPRQATVIPTNQYFKNEYAESYAEYNPEKAKELLDDMGMIDRDGDGYREMPKDVLENMYGEEVTFEGDSFNPTMIYPTDDRVIPTPVMELVKYDWEEIGIDVKLKEISRELIHQRRNANNFDISGWGLDNTTGIGFGDLHHMAKCFCPTDSTAPGPWHAWGAWYARSEQTEEIGKEPPDEIKKLIDWGEKLFSSTDPQEREKAATNLLEAQSGNLWGIGTVGVYPTPIIVSNKLKNVPEKGIWDWSSRYMMLHYPMQFYLEQ